LKRNSPAGVEGVEPLAPFAAERVFEHSREALVAIRFPRNFRSDGIFRMPP
jgi:hypothetical protein